LAAAITRWRARGAKIAGVLAKTNGIPDRACGAGFLRDIVSGRPYSIHRETVSRNTTCHLDASGVEAACANLQDQIPACDLLVLSKFGKLEPMHQGSTEAFIAAYRQTRTDKHFRQAPRRVVRLHPQRDFACRRRCCARSLVACLERSEGSYAPSGMTADRGIVCKTEQRPATMRRHFVLAQIASAADRIAYGCRADVKDGKHFLTSIDYSYVASTVRPFDPVALSACRPRCVSHQA
jgi:hypothetical protein